jgi:hypothetical protein
MLRPFLAGSGIVEGTPDGVRLRLAPTSTYADAQLDDGRGRPRSRLLHAPPTRLTLEARASSASPAGTLGFGFWNDPFPTWAGEAGARRALPASPRAVWFFHASPPSQLPFAPDGPQAGWTAAAYRGPAVAPILLAPVALAGAAGMLAPPLRSPLMRLYWRIFTGRQSGPLGGLDSWHAYRIDWLEEGVRFFVDDRPALEAAVRVRGPLGLVLWIDNQWAALSAETGLRGGVLRTDSDEWLELRELRLNGTKLEVDGPPPPSAAD